MECGLPGIGLGIYVALVPEQKLDAFLVISFGCQMKWRESSYQTLSRFDVGTFLNKEFSSLDLAHLRGRVQRRSCFAEVVDGVDQFRRRGQNLIDFCYIATSRVMM